MRYDEAWMGYRDACEPLRARIFEMDRELTETRARVLPAFWRLEQGQAVESALRALAGVDASRLSEEGLRELLDRYARARTLFDQALLAASEREQAGTVLPEMPPPASSVDLRTAIDGVLGPQESLLERLWSAAGRETIRDHLRDLDRALPDGATARVSVERGVWHVWIQQHELHFYVSYTHNLNGNNATPFLATTSVAVPVGTLPFVIRTKGYWDDLLGRFGKHQVPLGHEELDRLLVVEGTDDAALDVFRPPLQAALLAASKLDLVRIVVHPGWATMHGAPHAQTFAILRYLREFLHAECYLRKSG